MELDLIKLTNDHPNINITVKSGELLEMVKYCISETKNQIEQQLTDESQEKYLSPEKTAELLGVHLTSLWRWNKANYLKPIEIGGKRRYRFSDINRILKVKSC